MNILLVYPETPNTFWSFKSALKFISKKSSEPPLGLLTVAAMLPDDWSKKLVDLNVTQLNENDLKWADYVFLSGMNVHIDSMKSIISRCNNIGVKIIAGGPMATSDPQEFSGVDHFILNEAEITLPQFLNDLKNRRPEHVYKTDEFPDITQSPAPMWQLLDQEKYANMSIQYSRGCPFDCEFCSITTLNGRKPRTKTAMQFVAEIESLYQQGGRGVLFVVDDNFIGNKRKLKQEILPAIIEWSKEREYPFSFMTEVSINLADDEELLDLMVQAGFDSAFIGIETPNDESLAECGKVQNQSRDMVDAVKKLQRKGIVVSGGFIIGFDNDPPSIFEQQIKFIQNSGIVTAMVGMLNAPTGSKLFQRMKKENRLLKIMSGDNMDGSMNFIPKMNAQKLKQGYARVLNTIYSPKEFYQRVKTFLSEYNIPTKKPKKINPRDVGALFKSIWYIGLRNQGRRYYWNLFFYSLFRHPKKFPIAITMAVYGFHFRRVVETI